MKPFAWLTIASTIVLLSAAPAVAALTAYATWNAGPSTDPDWIAGNYPAWSDEPGFDWIAHLDGPGQAVSGYPWTSPRQYPDSDGVGKWGGALKDDVGDGSTYVTVQHGIDYPGGPLTLVDAQGTVEFWFKPMWDTVLDTNVHGLVDIGRDSTNRDGLLIMYNGDGTMTTHMREYATLVDLGHNWTANPLIANDWNHIAIVWDPTGICSYANGSRVGQTVYGDPAPVKMNWDTEWLGAFFGQPPSSTAYQSDGLWDSMAVWSDVRYGGDTYDMPTEEIGPIICSLHYNAGTGNLTLDTNGYVLNGFIIQSIGEFTGTAMLPPGFTFNDNDADLIASQFGSTLTGIWDFGNGAALPGVFSWSDEWQFTYTLEGQAGIYAGTIIGSVPGDADLDGDVDAYDIQQILAADSFMKGTGWSWGDGDFDGDGDVDSDDVQLILATGLYDQGPYGPALAAMAGDSIPEPATLSLLAIGGLVLLRKKSAAGRLDARGAPIKGGAK